MDKTGEKMQNSGKSWKLNLRNIITLNNVLIVIIIMGIIFRITTFWTLPPAEDGSSYIAVGHSFSKTGKFMTPWGGDYGTGNSTNLEYTRISPVFPSYLAFFYLIFGYSIEITQIAGLILALITLSIIYLTTRNLFNHRKGLIVTAIISMTRPFIVFPGLEYGENMVLLFFVLTLWSFIKGLKDSRYMIAFGFFGGVLFLTKIHSVHFIFIIAVVIGFFLWRFYYMGWKVIKQRNYVLGGAIFLIITLGWQIRNYMRFSGTSEVGSFSYASSGLSNELIIMFLLKLPFLIILAGVCFLFWARELKAIFAKIKVEYYNVLWVFSIGFFLLIWVVTSLMGGTDIHNRNIVFRLNHIRYIAPIYVSILWLVMKDHNWTHQGKKVHYFSREVLLEIKKWIVRIFREKKTLLGMIICAIVGVIVLLLLEFFLGVIILFATPSLAIYSVRKKLAIMLLAFSIVSLNAATSTQEPPYVKVASGLQEMLNEGDILMQDGEWAVPSKFNLYPYLAKYDVKVMKYDENINATYIFSYEDRNYTGYELIREYYWEGELGIIIKIRNKFLGLFFSKFSNEDDSSKERMPDAWLWRRV
ncbi:MAG: glycosyltransferase family 39 protein [Thermoplasmata archaeon]|nr:MAG: glycosyltransferase family 39 protein [Thermoplasmata archaeon]